MDKAQQSAIFAVFLEKELSQLKEQDASTRAWRLVDKTALPRQCFLWTEDPDRKSTWHLPYREGAGGIDPKTGMYEKAGPVNLGALRAIASAIAGGGTDAAMNVPSQIRSKINKLLKRYKIGRFQESYVEKGKEIFERAMSQQFVEAQLDKENHVVRNVAVLRATSKNTQFPKATSREYSETARQQAAEMVEGAKAYVNHTSKEELKKRMGVRDVRETLGHYSNGQIIEGVVRGDLHYLANHAVWLEPLVENEAERIGNSVHAFGELVFDSIRKTEVVESLHELRSIDLVSETGSTINLFEADVADDEEIIEVIEEHTMEIKDLTLQDLTEGRPDLVSKIQAGVKESHDQAEKISGLEAQNATLLESKNVLAKKVDDHEAADKARAKEESIRVLVAEAKLPDEYLTDTFKTSLREAKDEEGIKALIEDRKTLISKTVDGVKGMGDEKKDVTEASKISKDVAEDEFVEAVKGAR